MIPTFANMEDQRQTADGPVHKHTFPNGFTAFVAYEYTNTRGISNLHRNVLFRTAVVPPAPIGHFDASDDEPCHAVCGDGRGHAAGVGKEGG